MFEEDWVWLLILIIALGSYWYFRHLDYTKNREIVSSERDEFLHSPIPTYIQKSMQAFNDGKFEGEDQSPLAYVGYKAGKTAGMNEKERRERLTVCFRLDVPANLPSKYRNWGKPATALRFYKMHTHLNMLAQQRRGRRGYETAVHHWSTDGMWFINKLSETAKRFGRYGFRR